MDERETVRELLANLWICSLSFSFCLSSIKFGRVTNGQSNGQRVRPPSQLGVDWRVRACARLLLAQLLILLPQVAFIHPSIHFSFYFP